MLSDQWKQDLQSKVLRRQKMAKTIAEVLKGIKVKPKAKKK